MDEKILESIKSKVSEDEFKALVNIQQKNVVALATDQAFALRDAAGEIRAFKQRVRLSKEEGTLIQPVPGAPWSVSAQGYEILAEASGVAVIFPQDCIVDGEVRRNPYVLRDTQNGRVLAVYARAVAYRFSSKGLPQVCDWTSMFDLPSYRLIDLIAKAKDAPSVFKLLPIDDVPPAATGTTWAKYPFDNSTTLWINTSHPGALDWYKAILNREKKAVDFCQTFARRNATKHLLGIQKAPGPVWDLTVFCWRPTSGNLVKWDYTRYAEVRKQIEDAAGGGSFEGQKPEVVKGKDEALADEAPPEEIDLDDAVDVEHRVVDATVDTGPAEELPQGAAPQATPEPAQSEPKRKLTKEEQGIVKGFEMAREAFPGVYQKALAELMFKPPLTVEEMQKIEARMNRMLDENL
jgi:hypothetical protein